MKYTFDSCKKLVRSSTPHYLWILSRSPKMEESVYNNLLKIAEARGYDFTDLQKVPQKIN